MDSYALGKDIQEIKILLQQLISRLDAAEHQSKGVACHKQLDPRKEKGHFSIFLTTEEVLWQGQVGTATAAFNYWVNLMALAGGSQNNRSLNAAEVTRWMCIIRAVSFVESRHGSVVGGVHGDTDPMQCGNPGDSWWRELTGQTGVYSRFVGGQGADNYDSNELPDAVAATAPDAVRLSRLANAASGHNDPNFNPAMSYFWGIVWLLHRANTGPGTDDRFYKCGECLRDRLINGAVRYNGGGVPDYRQRIESALYEIGCM